MFSCSRFFERSSIVNILDANVNPLHEQIHSSLKSDFKLQKEQLDL